MLQVLLAAIVRAQGGRQGGAGSTSTGVTRGEMVVYGSDQTHAIIEKACLVLGVGHYRQLPTCEEDGWGLRGETLRRAVLSDREHEGLFPIAAVATPGTTSSCAFDRIDELADVSEDLGLWLHVDAAYGGAYACLPEEAPRFSGCERADSFCVNCHKKLLCPFDLAALYVADRAPLLEALSLQPEYLRNAASASGAVVDFEHWQLPLGRRFRALKLWFTFRRYGQAGLRAHVRKGVELRRHFEALLAADESQLLAIAAPPSLSLVCFRLRGYGEDAQQALLARLREGGECFVIHTKLGGKIVLRIACGGTEMEEAHVTAAWNIIRDAATAVVRSGEYQRLPSA
jgi:aromatic-L-amino-acid decarboxylase